MERLNATAPLSSALDPIIVSEIQRAGTDDDSDADTVLALGERHQRRGQLGSVGGERGEQFEQRLRKPERDTEPVQAPRERACCAERDREREREQHQG